MYFLATVTRFFLALRYRITFRGESLMKETGAKLFLPNHQALVDPIIMVSYEMKYQYISPVLTSTFYNIPVLKSMFKWMQAVPVSDPIAGNRDTSILQFIYSHVIEALRTGRNILLYPAGQLTNKGHERIFNKQSAWQITQHLPEGTRIIGVRVYGLWGSMWSRAKTGKTPNFAVLFLKSAWIVMANFLFFIPKRNVSLEFVDITEEALAHAALGRKEYNAFLEAFYNTNEEETMRSGGHYFWGPKPYFP